MQRLDLQCYCVLQVVQGGGSPVPSAPLAPVPTPTSTPTAGAVPSPSTGQPTPSPTPGSTPASSSVPSSTAAASQGTSPAGQSTSSSSQSGGSLSQGSPAGPQTSPSPSGCGPTLSEQMTQNERHSFCPVPNIHVFGPADGLAKAEQTRDRTVPEKAGVNTRLVSGGLVRGFLLKLLQVRWRCAAALGAIHSDIQQPASQRGLRP